jgi:hypothetical protein
MAINIHEQMDSQQESLMNPIWASRGVPLFRRQPLHHVAWTQAERQAIHGDKLRENQMYHS